MPSGEGAVPYQRPRPQLSITWGHSQPAALGGDSVAGQPTVFTTGAAVTRSVQAGTGGRGRPREGAGDPVEGQRRKRTRVAAAADDVPVQPSQFRVHEQQQLTLDHMNLVRLQNAPNAVTAEALRSLLSVLAEDTTTASLQAVRALDSYVIPGTHHSCGRLTLSTPSTYVRD